MKLDTLFENFDLLMDAPNAVPKMRDLILQLAVQGELVEQDPNDEPASALLKKIRLEKEKLIKEGKTKKQSFLPPINLDEMPFELPDNWEWSRFGELVDFFTGKTPSTKDSTYWSDDNDGYPWISISDMVGGGWVGETKRRISDKAVKEVFKCSSVDFGTLIMSFKLTLGKVSFIGVPAYHNEAIIAIYPHIGVMKDFLLKVLPLLVTFGQSKDAIKGRTLNKNSLTLLGIPLPPLAEQKRIVAKVDQLIDLCDQLDVCQKKASTKYTSLNDAALEKLLSSKTIDEFADQWQFLCNNFEFIYNDPAHVNKLRRAILQLAVQGKLAPQDHNDEPASELLKRIKAEKERLIAEGKIKKQKALPPITEDEIAYELPQGWEWVKLQDVFDVRDGTHDTPKYVMDGFPLVTSKNLKNGRVDFSDIKYISEEDHIKISIRSKVDQGDILFAMIGSIGNPVIVEEDNFSIKNVALFKYYDVNLTTNRYLFYFLKFASVEMQDISLGGVQSFVSLGFLRNYLFPLPPYPEQKRIVAKVDQLMRHCDELEIRLNQSKNNSGMLMDAVLYEAFS